jgi:hypothetical protein
MHVKDLSNSVHNPWIVLYERIQVHSTLNDYVSLVWNRNVFVWHIEPYLTVHTHNEFFHAYCD